MWSSGSKHVPWWCVLHVPSVHTNSIIIYAVSHFQKDSWWWWHRPWFRLPPLSTWCSHFCGSVPSATWERYDFVKINKQIFAPMMHPSIHHFSTDDIDSFWADKKIIKIRMKPSGRYHLYKQLWGLRMEDPNVLEGGREDGATTEDWKFYHTRPITGLTYPPNISPFGCSWAEIDFWGREALINENHLPTSNGYSSSI